MADEVLFHRIALVLVLVTMPVGIWHRLRSRVRGERLDRRQEGLILVPLRLCGLLFLGGLLAYLIRPTWLAEMTLPLPAVVRWLGVGLGVLAWPLGLWVFRSLGRNLTDTVVCRENATLVTTGPYRWVRHPFYCFGFLFFLSLSLVSARAYLLVAGLLALVLIALRTPIEERKLLERFGEEYRAYMRRTGRFFPRLRSSLN